MKVADEEAMIKLKQENKALEQKVKVSKGEVKNHQNIERELVQKNCDMMGRIAALESEMERNESEENKQLKEQVLLVETEREQVKDDLEQYKNTVKRLESEIEQHMKLGEEIMTEGKKPGKDEMKEKKIEITSLKRQVTNHETESSKMKTKLDQCLKDLEARTLETNREKDINNILIRQVKEQQGKKPETKTEEEMQGRSRNSSIEISGEYEVLSDTAEPDSKDFCKKDFMEGHGKCKDRECKDNHDIDFSKRGVCIYEFQTEGSCRRKMDCWFLHQIPKWYRSLPGIESIMKEKIEKIKSRSRIIMSRNTSTSFTSRNPKINMVDSQVPLPVWQNQMINTTPPNVSGGRVQITPSLSPMRRLQSQSQTSEDFLELITKYVEERIKSQSEVD